MTRILILAFVLTACAAPAPVVEEAPTSSLTGSWRWVETAGGKTGGVRTPRTEGYAVTLLFGDNGRFALLRDGETSAAGRFEREEGILLYRIDVQKPPSTPITWFGLGEPPRHELSLDAAGDLVLDEGCCDRYRHIFRRNTP